MSIFKRKILIGLIILIITISSISGLFVVNNFLPQNRIEAKNLQSFDPLSEGWKSYEIITIDHTRLNGNQSNFPILISIIDSNLQDKTQVYGEDIIFMNNLGISEKLYHEIEYFNRPTGDLIVWINVPFISGVEDTNLYMYYNNPDIKGQQKNFGQNEFDNIWDSKYLAFYHIADTNEYEGSLDQYMILFDGGLPIGRYTNDSVSYYWIVTQSFKPNKPILTRIQLLLGKNIIQQTEYPLTISLRKNLNGSNLKSIKINPGEISNFPLLTYFEFDFDDFEVNVGETYYIVCQTEDFPGNIYFWGANSKNLYNSGQVFFSIDNGKTWSNITPIDGIDLCFRTFGKNN